MTFKLIYHDLTVVTANRTILCHNSAINNTNIWNQNKILYCCLFFQSQVYCPVKTETACKTSRLLFDKVINGMTYLILLIKRQFITSNLNLNYQKVEKLNCTRNN